MKKRQASRLVVLLSGLACQAFVPSVYPLRAQTASTADEKHRLGNLEARLGKICQKLNSPCPRLVIDTLTKTPLKNERDRIVVSASFASLARTPVEEVALAALMIAWFNQPDVPVKSKRSDLPEQLLAIGALGLGDKIDPLRDPADRNRRSDNFQYKGNTSSRQAPMVAQRALALATSAGSCSGALVNLLNRAKNVNVDASPRWREQDTFARLLLSQLGYSIMPPDESCLNKIAL